MKFQICMNISDFVQNKADTEFYNSTFPDDALFNIGMLFGNVRDF